MILPHEDVDIRRLTVMPVTVRRKLAESGGRLADGEWRALPQLARQRLVDMRVERAVERRAFAKLIGWLRTTFLESDAQDAPTVDEGTFVWRASAPPPALGLEQAVWQLLGIDARYALVVAGGDHERRRILEAYDLTGRPGAS